MADITYRTQNVSIEDEDTGVQANVNASNELQVRDDDANTNLLEIVDHTQSMLHYTHEEKIFVLPGTVTLPNKNETDVFLIRNQTDDDPTDIDLHFWQYRIGSLNNTAATLRAYRNPTITTNGTAQTPRNYIVSGAASVMDIYASPTIASRGTLMEILVIPSGTPLTLEEEFGYVVSPGEDMLITIQSEAANVTFDITAIWLEDNTPA